MVLDRAEHLALKGEGAVEGAVVDDTGLIAADVEDLIRFGHGLGLA